ncbi:16629_t:CDS:1 [Cetraspora pellucida]|uniref:16629_t:CDS:1 n=1 Tax=Cetraspora pellucida TaxID=1433469 RepID=A0A9N9C384_9GLOM|nr:16629_t:CDS:1 [Cetraspora pellucida]
MPKPSKCNIQLKNAHESFAKKYKLNKFQEVNNESTNNLKKINKELKSIDDMTSDILNVDKSDSSKIYNMIIDSLKDMSKKDLQSISYLLCTIRYLYRKNKDHIISFYIQNKTFEYISKSLYKSGKSLDELNHQNKQLKQDIQKLQ